MVVYFWTHSKITTNPYYIDIYYIYFLPNPFIFFHPAPNHPPLRQLSVSFMYPCFCFCFVHQFILFFKFHISVRSYGICLSLTGLFHLAQCSPGPTMLSQKVRFPSFLWPSGITWYKCTRAFLSTHHLRSSCFLLFKIGRMFVFFRGLLLLHK